MHIEHTTHDAVRLRQRPHSSPSSSPGKNAKGSNDGESRRGTIQQAGSLFSTTKPKLRGDSMSEPRTEKAARPVTLWPTVPGKGSEDGEEERRGLSETEKKKRGGDTIGKSAFLRTKCEILCRLSRGAGRRSGDNDTDRRNRSRQVENNDTQSSSQQRCISTVPRQQSSLRRTRSTRHTHDGESFHGESRRSERTTRSKSRPTSDHHYSIYPSPPQTQSPLHSPELPRRNGTTRDPLSASSSYREKLYPGITDKDKENENERPFKDQDQRREDLPEGPAHLDRTGALKGKNLWRAGPLDPCRLCKTRSVEGMRGLCRECEGDFVRPETMVSDRRLPTIFPSSQRRRYDFKDDEDGGQGDSEEEVKPPVPLKDKRTLDLAAKTRREGKEKVRDEYGNSTTEKRGRSGSMPDAAPDSNSVMGKIDGRYWDGQDQALFIAREKEKTQRIIRSWGVRQERTERRKRKEDEEKKRRTSFYRFWDDIL